MKICSYVFTSLQSLFSYYEVCIGTHTLCTYNRIGTYTLCIYSSIGTHTMYAYKSIYKTAFYEKVLTLMKRMGSCLLSIRTTW